MCLDIGVHENAKMSFDERARAIRGLVSVGQNKAGDKEKVKSGSASASASASATLTTIHT